MTGLSASQVKRIELAEIALRKIAAGSGFSDIVSAIGPAIPSAAASVEFFPSGNPWNSIAHVAGFPQDCLEWMLGSYTMDVTPAQLVASPTNVVLSKVRWFDGMVAAHGLEVADWWEYHKSNIFRLGDHINIKLGVSPVARDSEHIGFSIFRAHGESPFSDAEIASVVHLASSIKDVLRLQRIPVSKDQPLLASLFAQTQSGFALLDRSGQIHELNRSLIDLLCTYMRLDSRQPYHHLTDRLLARWLAHWKRGGESCFLAPALPGGIALTVSCHLLSAEAHSLPDDRFLIRIEPADWPPGFEVKAPDVFRQLTDREREIAKWLTETPLSIRDIAARLGITPSTARKHVEAIYRTCKVSSRSELRALHKNAQR